MVSIQLEICVNHSQIVSPPLLGLPVLEDYLCLFLPMEDLPASIVIVSGPFIIQVIESDSDERKRDG